MTDEARKILDWCRSVVGPCEIVSGDVRFHGRTSVWRLRTPDGYCYVKIHRERSYWEADVHGHECWAPAFARLAPKLVATHEAEPLALIVSELPGRPMDKVQLPVQQERLAWRAAGSALARLHDFAVGEVFGPCRRDGTCAGVPVRDAGEYLSIEFERWTARGIRAASLDDEELAIIRAARNLIPAFAGERPVPCHRDYCPANWLIGDDGVWIGAIDFEFSQWDVRVADFSRYPDWEWMTRPDLLEAFFEGYGRSLTAEEEQQRLVAHTLYALGAIVWGREHSFHGFEAEGRRALRYLANLLH